MKTLLLTEVFPPQTGGSGRWFWEIYRRLPVDSHLIVAGVYPHAEEFDRTHQLSLLRLPLAFSTWGVASLAGLRQYGGMVWRLRRLIRQKGIDVIHAGKTLPEGLLAWMLKRWCGLPYLCYVHGEELNLTGTSRELTWLNRKVLQGAERVLANSQNTSQLLRMDWQVPEERIHVLHPGVDTERFTPAEQNSEVRARLGWDDRPVLLTVGRLQKRKGHDHLIRALTAIQAVIPNVLYAVVGDGEERAALDNLTTQLGVSQQVQFLDEVSDADLLVCYQQCDLFVLPNRQVDQDIEGFGMVLLEAQACGKPVVAGDSGGTRETMCIPETGEVVNCDTPDLLAEAIIKLLSDRNRLVHMGERARSWVVERFDWVQLTRRAEVLFSQLTGNSCETLGQLTGEHKLQEKG